jgi:hypothetical protein
MYNAQNYSDPIKAYSPDLEGLHCPNQEQYACSKPGGRRGIKRVLREAQYEDRGVTKQANWMEAQAMARRKDQPVDLDTYISKNGRFKSFVYDRREIRTIADNLGLKTDRVRTGLRKLGYYLIQNNHGRMVWKRDGVSIFR